MKICKEKSGRIVRLEGKEERTLEAAVEICRELADENKDLDGNKTAAAIGQLIGKYGMPKRGAAGTATEANGEEPADEAAE